MYYEIGVLVANNRIRPQPVEAGTMVPIELPRIETSSLTSESPLYVPAAALSRCQP